MARNDDLDITNEDMDMYEEDETLDETGEKGGRITTDETYMDEDTDDDQGFFDDLEDEEFL